MDGFLSCAKAAPGSETLVAGLCHLALLSTEGIGLVYAAVSRSLEDRLNGVVFASNEVARSVDELQAVLGVGPASTALQTASPVLCGNLVKDGPGRKGWSTFLSEADNLGINSVWVLPLQIGAVSMGTLTLSGPGLAKPQGGAIATVLKVADALTTVLLVPDASEAQLHLVDLQDADQVVIHQATGMVSVQLGVTLAEAQVVLRAAAFAQSGGLSQLARSVVARLRRFDPPEPA